MAAMRIAAEDSGSPITPIGGDLRYSRSYSKYKNSLRLNKTTAS